MEVIKRAAYHMEMGGWWRYSGWCCREWFLEWCGIGGRQTAEGDFVKMQECDADIATYGRFPDAAGQLTHYGNGEDGVRVGI